MNVTINLQATELAEAMNNLAVALSDMMAARADMKASKTTAEVVAKASKKPAAPAPAQTTEPTPPPVAEGSASEAAVSAAPITHDAAKTLAALKAKKVGPSVVKGVIADTGYGQIADIPEQALLVSLYKNLEAL